MADDSNIEWLRPPWVKRGATWNMIGGCERISPGCENCWAERDTARFAVNPATPRFKGLAQFRPDGEARWSREVRPWPDKLAEPLRWREPRGVFVCSKSDLFHRDVPFEFIAAVFGVMAACPQHTFFVLTKRPARALEWFAWVQRRERDGMSVFPGDTAEWRIGQMLVYSASKNGIQVRHGNQPWPLPNVFFGATMEDQQRADERLLDLVQIPAALRWVSYEPAVGPLALGLLGTLPKTVTEAYTLVADRIGWIVAGGESGHGARPAHPKWFRDVRDECAAAQIPFFFKQWGSWQSVDQSDDMVGKVQEFVWPDGTIAFKLGKKRAGRLLDGVEHSAYPVVSPWR